MNDRYFYIKDIDCTITVEYATRKEMLEMIDNFIDNCKIRDELDAAKNPNARFYDMSLETFAILYKDGSIDYIDECYDYHHVKRQNIVSIINVNTSTIIVFGHFGLTECGAAEPTFEDEIDDTLIEVDTEEQTESEVSEQTEAEQTSEQEESAEQTEAEQTSEQEESAEQTEAEQTSEQEESAEQTEAEQTSEQEESAEQTEAETVQKTPSVMKNDINKKFGVNCVYYDTDSIMCDNTKQIVNTYKEYIVRAFENNKEITVQCTCFSRREYAIDYINNLYENGVVSRDVVFTINNSGIYDCFSDVKMTGTTAQIKYATDMLNAFYKQLCVDIAFEYKIRIYEDIDIERKDYYANLNTYVTILKKALNGNCAKSVITNNDKFEVWGNVYRTANNFIIAYNDEKPNWFLKHLERKMRMELNLLQ